MCVGLLSLPDFDLELASASASSLSVSVAANITSSSSSVSSSRGTELSNLQVVYYSFNFIRLVALLR